MARIKTLAELYDALTTGMTLLPAGHIGYRHFRGDAEPPMLVYYETDIEPTAADNTLYFSGSNVTIELYTADLRDLQLEQQLEAVLLAGGLVYDKTITYIDGERLYECSYSVEIC